MNWPLPLNQAPLNLAPAQAGLNRMPDSNKQGRSRQSDEESLWKEVKGTIQRISLTIDCNPAGEHSTVISLLVNGEDYHTDSWTAAADKNRLRLAQTGDLVTLKVDGKFIKRADVNYYFPGYW